MTFVGLLGEAGGGVGERVGGRGEVVEARRIYYYYTVNCCCVFAFPYLLYYCMIRPWLCTWYVL